jgi:hypothetical protein
LTARLNEVIENHVILIFVLFGFSACSSGKAKRSELASPKANLRSVSVSPKLRDLSRARGETAKKLTAD